MKAAPVIETARLVLRGHRREDYEAIHAMWEAPEVYRHISGKPSTREQSWQRLLRYAGIWPLLGYGFWAVTDKQTASFIGEVGFCDFHRDCVPPLGDNPEMGWVFSPSWHGKGFGKEAVHAALGWADTVLQPASIVSFISPVNAASAAIARGAGFKPSHQAKYMGETVEVHERKL